MQQDCVKRVFIAASELMPMLNAQVEEKKHHLDLTTRDDKETNSASAAPVEGSMVNAQITSVSGAAPSIAFVAVASLEGSPQPCLAQAARCMPHLRVNCGFS